MNPTRARRQRVMAANWKMHKTPAETAGYFRQLASVLPAAPGYDAVIAPPFPCLAAAAEAARGLPLALAGQNMHWAPEGAFTGEVSAAMLLAVGCRYVILGHSERRQLFGETDENVRRKLQTALAAGLTPIVCVGESQAERQQGETEAVLRRQCERALSGVLNPASPPCLLAYEPIWAIGTGNTANPDIAQSAHHALRRFLSESCGPEVAARTPILYGGSIKLDNAPALMACADVDGGLVGGASLDPATFARLLAP